METGKLLLAIAAALIPTLCYLGFWMFLSYTTDAADNEIKNVIKAKMLISEANAVSKRFYDCGVAMGGYSITKSPLFESRYNAVVGEMKVGLNKLEKIVRSEKPVNKKNIKAIEEIRKLEKNNSAVLETAMNAIKNNSTDKFKARHFYKEVRQNSEAVTAKLRILTEEARQIEGQNLEESNRNRKILLVVTVSGVFFSIIVGFVQAIMLGLLVFFIRSKSKAA